MCSLFLSSTLFCSDKNNKNLKNSTSDSQLIQQMNNINLKEESNKNNLQNNSQPIYEKIKKDFAPNDVNNEGL